MSLENLSPAGDLGWLLRGLADKSASVRFQGAVLWVPGC